MAMPGIAEIVADLLRYGQSHPEEGAEVPRFLAFARSGPDVCRRTRRDGHFTASSWLMSKDEQRVLLTHHRKLDRWLQLGGHADGDTNLARVAWREAAEESGLAELIVDGAIFDIDAHTIPARGDEPEHIHWDVRYVVHCRGSEAFVVSEESHALAWRPVEELLSHSDPSLRRMACKWLARSHGRRSGIGQPAFLTAVADDREGPCAQGEAREGGMVLRGR